MLHYNTCERSFIRLGLVFFLYFTVSTLLHFNSSYSKGNSKLYGLGEKEVVCIEAMDNKGKIKESGSGCIVSSNGYILTDNHIIQGASKIRVILYNDTNYLVSKIIRTNEKVDLALLKIDASDLTSVTFEDPMKVFIGEDIWNIGAPLNYRNTFASGVVGATNRIANQINMLQLSLPADKGSSGSPVFNQKGRVIGLIEGGAESVANITFAIPTSEIQTFLRGINL